jgi:hypothetical protein
LGQTEISEVQQPIDEAKQDRMEEFSRLVFIHQIGEGKPLDPTVDHPALQELIEWAEKEQLIEIDVKGVRYKLTAKGKQLHEKQLDEAQVLIRKYDIFGDVDVDASGTAHFDSKLGNDLRVPIFELEDLDPFRARLLIGLNDGEWNDEDLENIATNIDFYDEVFAPIESAPTVEDFGKARLISVIDQGKAKQRAEGTFEDV